MKFDFFIPKILVRSNNVNKSRQGYINRHNILDWPIGSCNFCELIKGLWFWHIWKVFFINSLNLSKNLNCCKVQQNDELLSGTSPSTLPTTEILSGKNVRAFLVCGFLMKSFKKKILKIWKKSWEPFGSYLLNSTANSSPFSPKLGWIGCAI